MSATQQLSFSEVPAPKPRPYPYEKQARKLVEAAGDGKWRSLMEIEVVLAFKYSQTGLSARIRDIRKGALPGWSAERDTRDGKNFYRIWRTA